MIRNVTLKRDFNVPDLFPFHDSPVTSTLFTNISKRVLISAVGSSERARTKAASCPILLGI